MSNEKRWFLGGIFVGAMAILLLCAAAMAGGVITYFLMRGPVAGNGPSTAIVDSRLGWQSTGVQALRGTNISIDVTGGEWSYWPGVEPYGSGEGGRYVCTGIMPAANCVEPLPDFPSDGLIGKIGNQVFAVGRGTSLSVEQSGMLWLRINDGDPGLQDNDGELTVVISVQR